MLINLTPNEFRCLIGACSGVFLKDETVYLVGQKIERTGEFSEISIGEDEELIALPLGLFKDVKFPDREDNSHA